MQRIVAGGTGLVGRRLVEHWLAEQHRVTVIGRSLTNIEHLFDKRVTAVTWDALSANLFKSAEVVVNLSGENIGAQRWTEKQKKLIIDSRVKSTKSLVDILTQLDHPPALFNASAIGVYGLQQQTKSGLPPALDENTLIDSQHPRDYLSEVGVRWEEATELAKSAGCRVVKLRFGVVLAAEDGALPKLMQAFNFFLGGPLGSGRQAFSWVAIEDLIQAIDFLLAKPDLIGAFNIVAPGCVTQAEFAKTLGQVMNRPSFLTMPSFILKIMLGTEMAESLLLEGQHVEPKRLLTAGFNFSYPNIELALRHCLAKND